MPTLTSINEFKKQDTSKKLKIFVSHKQKDEATAKAIVNELRTYSDDIDFFISEEIPKGTEWSRKIHEYLKETDWLILIYTDPSETWDWCLYETGFFMASAAKKKRRLICLHRTDVDPPDPIKQWQTVRANQKEVIELLKNIFGPVSKGFVSNPNKLALAADTIVNAIGPKPISEPYNKFFFLSFDQNAFEQINKTGVIPGEVKISSDEKAEKPLSMFGFAHKECKWADVTSHLNHVTEKQWARHLGYIIRALNEDQNINTALPLFQSSAEKKIYRPVLHNRTWIPNREYNYKLIFVEIPFFDEDIKPVGDIGMMSILLTIARRFRTLIVDKYIHEINRLTVRHSSEKEASVLLENLDMALLKLESQAETMGFSDSDTIIAAFRDKETRDKVKEMFQNWRDLRLNLAKKIHGKNIEGVMEILENFRNMNKEFSKLACRHYLSLLEET